MLIKPLGLLKAAAAAPSGTNILAGAGDFSSATGWSLDAGVEISGGTLNFVNAGAFKKARRIGVSRAVCPPNETLDVSFDVVTIVNTGRISILLQSYDSGGTAIDSDTTAFDTNADGALAVGTMGRAAAYTTPANTATVQVTFRNITGPVDATFDNFTLVY